MWCDAMTPYTHRFKVNGVLHVGWKKLINGKDYFVWWDFGCLSKRKLCVLCTEATDIQEI